MKKLFSLVLAALLLFSCFSALTVSAADYDHLPQVYVEGIDSKHIFYKDDVNMENPLFYPLDGDMLFSNLLDYKSNIEKAVKQGNPDLITEYLYQWMLECYGMIALGKDGYTMSDEVMVPETTLNYKGDGKYVFQYDARLSPLDIVTELDSYIRWVQSDSGSDRIELAGSSYGASVVVTYLHEYPEMKNNIDSVVLCVPSTNGVNFAGELFSGSFNFDSAAIKAFVDHNVGSDELSLLLSTLIKTGTLDSILDSAVEPIVKAAVERAIKLVVHDIFGTFPSMWSFVEDEYFYDALKNIYGENYADPDHDYAVHIAKITEYHEKIHNNAYEIVLETKESGVHFSILTKYGQPPLPLSKQGNFMGDGFVALEKASFGATSSMNQEKLPKDYKQQKHTEYNLMSPEGCVDASTCLLPFNTWFIRGISHGSKNDGYYELINTVLYEDLDIFNEKFPQYLMVPEYDDEALVPMTADVQPDKEKETTWLEDFLAFIKSIIPRLIEMIKGLFNK